jgi:uncharacterized protein YbjT (DUF2867 family)
MEPPGKDWVGLPGPRCVNADNTRHQVRSLNHGIGFDTAAIERGCEVAAANLDDAASLTAAFEGVAGVFVLPPSEFDPLPGFPEARAVIDAVMTALAHLRGAPHKSVPPKQPAAARAAAPHVSLRAAPHRVSDAGSSSRQQPL